MTEFEHILQSRRDTRHFTDEEVPEEVIEKALQAGHWAPSVGLTDATRYYVIKSGAVKKAVKKLFSDYHQKAQNCTDSAEQKADYVALKLEAIEEAPIGLVIAYDRSVLNSFSIGTVGSNEAVKFSAVCAAQNIWLSLTAQGFGMGWVSILNYDSFKKTMGLPEHIEPLGYFCVGKPATNYDNQPMLQQLKWKQKSAGAVWSEIDSVAVLKNDWGVEKQEKKLDIKEDFEEKIQQKIDSKTKPVGSLGVLEDLSKKIALVFNSLEPKINRPHIVVFAADHGIANHGLSAYPQDVTRQMVANFLEGGAAINVFCKQNKIELTIVDAGVNYDFPTNTALVSAKIAKGTQSFLQMPAMSFVERDLCFEKGKSMVAKLASEGCNCVGFGEMGIGNTATASVLMSLLLKIPIEDCVGRGTGISDEKLMDKQKLLKQAIENYSGSDDLESLIAYFGGFEILQMAGGMLEAYNQRMLVLVDGFISTVAYLIAFEMNNDIQKNAVLCHQSAEQAHKKLVEYLGLTPILTLEMRLGEGTGCALAMPLIESAVVFLNQMASFESAGISGKKV